MMLQRAKSFVDGKEIYPKIILNEAWDEWSEGSVLAPTARWNFGYLEAIKEVFGENICGNGICEASENKDSCPIDCP